MKRANFTSSAEQRRYQYILLQRHLAGDPEATEILYSLLTTYLQSHLPNYIRRRSWLLSREDLEEAVSTALHNCSVSFSTFRGEALLTSWAFYYAIHAAGNLHMKNCRYLRHFEWSVDISECRTNAADNPLDLVIERERNDALYRAFFRLDPLSRNVVFYRVLEGKTLYAVARKLKISGRYADICFNQAISRMKDDYNRFYQCPYTRKSVFFSCPMKR